MRRTVKNFNALEACLAGVKSLAIAGHVRPDGDCVGSCMAVYNYVRENMPQIQVDVYLQEIPESLDFLKGTEDIHHSCEENKTYDAFLALDCGDRERLGAAVRYFDSAKKRICVDHHISNTGLGEQYVIDPAACATCEILYELLNPEKMSLAVAEALYTGLINDCGVFQYSNTTPKTMRIAAKLMEKGVPAWKILAITFTNKAAKEMAERVQALTGEAGSEAWISTFHACCARILRRDIEKLGYKRQFAIYDEDDRMSVIKAVLKELNLETQPTRPPTMTACQPFSAVATHSNEVPSFAAVMRSYCVPLPMRMLTVPLLHTMRTRLAMDGSEGSSGSAGSFPAS